MDHLPGSVGKLAEKAVRIQSIHVHALMRILARLYRPVVMAGLPFGVDQQLILTPQAIASHAPTWDLVPGHPSRLGLAGMPGASPAMMRR
jgi:hypothetical protein